MLGLRSMSMRLVYVHGRHIYLDSKITPPQFLRIGTRNIPLDIHLLSLYLSLLLRCKYMCKVWYHYMNYLTRRLCVDPTRPTTTVTLAQSRSVRRVKYTHHIPLLSLGVQGASVQNTRNAYQKWYDQWCLTTDCLNFPIYQLQIFPFNNSEFSKHLVYIERHICLKQKLLSESEYS